MGYRDMFMGIAGGGISSALDFGLQALANQILPLSKAQRQQNEFNAQQASLARDFSAQQAEVSRDWQEEMYSKYNSLQGKINQANLAGVNPMYAVTGSAVSPMSPQSPAVQSPTASLGAASPVSQISDIASSALGFSKLSAEIKNIEASTRRQNGEAFLSEVRGLYEGRYQDARISELVASAKRLGADTNYLLASTDLVFANIGKVYAETDNVEERTKLVTQQIEQSIAQVRNLDADTSVKSAMLHQIGSQIRNLDADTQYKGYLCGLALEQQLTELSKREEISAHISWLSDDAKRLRQATSNAEVENILMNMEKGIKEWETKQAKRNYKWSVPQNTVRMVTDVVQGAASLVFAIKGLPAFPLTTKNVSDVSTFDEDLRPKHQKIGYK